MPITPFHFGPGAVLHALAPRHVSFLSFCTANVLMDVEPLVYMLTRNPPLHRFLHTYIGASLIILAVLVLFATARWFAKRFWLPNFFDWQSLRALPVLLGAAAGSYSHIVFDSVMHSDIRPFAPFSDANPLLGFVSLQSLHWFCLLAGVAAVLILAVRRLRASETR